GLVGHPYPQKSSARRAQYPSVNLLRISSTQDVPCGASSRLIRSWRTEGHSVMKQAIYFLASVLLLLAIFVAVERTSSPFFQSCISQRQNTNLIISYINCSGLLIERHGVGITALATLIIAAFTCTLWLATNSQAQLTRETLIADKRAFVFAVGVRSFYEPDPT